MQCQIPSWNQSQVKSSEHWSQVKMAAQLHCFFSPSACIVSVFSEAVSWLLCFSDETKGCKVLLQYLLENEMLKLASSYSAFLGALLASYSILTLHLIFMKDIDMDSMKLTSDCGQWTLLEQDHFLGHIHQRHQYVVRIHVFLSPNCCITFWIKRKSWHLAKIWYITTRNRNFQEKCQKIWRSFDAVLMQFWCGFDAVLIFHKIY